MHGLIFSELRKYVEDKHRPELWRETLRKAGFGGRIFLGVETYPDAELLSILGTLSIETRVPVPELTEDFGCYLAPKLLGTYSTLAKREWRTLELLEHVEETIHRVVRTRDAKAAPPELRCTRTTPREVVLVYTSPRRLCTLARGLVRGVAEHYAEHVTIREPTCMLEGAPECRLRVQLDGPR